MMVRVSVCQQTCSLAPAFVNNIAELCNKHNINYMFHPKTRDLSCKDSVWYTQRFWMETSQIGIILPRSCLQQQHFSSRVKPSKVPYRAINH